MTSQRSTDLSDLIERLEKAEGPSRELDIYVHAAIHDGYVEHSGPPENVYVIWRCGSDRDVPTVFGPQHVRDRVCNERETPRYTKSIDDALQLVPEGMEFEITNIYGPARCTMGLNVNDDAGPWYAERLDGNLTLALCIAALKARQESET